MLEEKIRTNKTSAFPNFIPQILRDDENAEGKNYLIQSKGKSSMRFIHEPKIE